MTNPILTSLPYPIYTSDTVSVAVGLSGGSLRSTLIKQPLADTLNISVGITSFNIRDLVRYYQLPLDTLTLNLQVSEITLRTVLKTYIISTDTVTANVSLQGGAMKDILRILSGYFKDTCNINCSLTAGSLS